MAPFFQQTCNFLPQKTFSINPQRDDYYRNLITGIETDPLKIEILRDSYQVFLRFSRSKERRREEEEREEEREEREREREEREESATMAEH